MHALKNDGVSNWSPRKLTMLSTTFGGDTELATINPENGTNNLKRTKFKDIDPEIEYTFRVCTLINGKTISRKLFTLKPKQKEAEMTNSSVQDA